MRVIVIGGGAAGFFAAIRLAELRPDAQVSILERGKDVLQKVKISGGGRCNLTHNCMQPAELVKFYPRGEKALRGPFHRFGPAETVAWFSDRGVPVKVEGDGRMFPQSNTSESVLNCLIGQAKEAGVEVLTSTAVRSLERQPQGGFVLGLGDGSNLQADKVLVAAGSSPAVWELLAKLGHSIVPPVPSLFTFNIKDPLIEPLPGLSLPKVQLRAGTKADKLQSEGPLLVTHWGLSGPAVLRLSAWGARKLAEWDYKFELQVNCLPQYSVEDLRDFWQTELRGEQARRQINSFVPFETIPKRWWLQILQVCGIPEKILWAELTKSQWQAISDKLLNLRLPVAGKSTFKEEFVTAGGVELKEVDFSRFESKQIPGLFFAGEILDIDAITGGFNFQAAWTGAWLAAEAMAEQ